MGHKMNKIIDAIYSYCGLYRYGYTMFHAFVDVSIIGAIAYLFALGVVAIMI
jgi:hypothetical protein